MTGHLTDSWAPAVEINVEQKLMELIAEVDTLRAEFREFRELVLALRVDDFFNTKDGQQMLLKRALEIRGEMP